MELRGDQTSRPKAGCLVQAPTPLDALRIEVETAAVADLPAIIGQIEALKAEAFARLLAPQPRASEADGDAGDKLLDVDQAAALLHQSPRWVRDHRDELPRVKLPGRLLRFSEKRLASFIKRRGYGS